VISVSLYDKRSLHRMLTSPKFRI